MFDDFIWMKFSWWGLFESYVGCNNFVEIKNSKVISTASFFKKNIFVDFLKKNNFHEHPIYPRNVHNC